MRPVPESIEKKLAPAAAAFAEHGFEHTRIDDVARATGIPRATLYYYFSGKEDVLAWLFSRMLERGARAVADAVVSEGTAAERLGRVVEAQLGVMAAEPATCRLLAAELGRAGRLPDVARGIDRTFHAPVRALLAEGAADESLIPVDDPETVAAALFGAVMTAGLHYVVADGHLPAQRVATQVVNLLMAGLAPRPQGR